MRLVAEAGSVVLLHTINASLRARARCRQLVTCLTWSSAPEGRSVNVVVGGLSDGRVRMWSSWDLTVRATVYF